MAAGQPQAQAGMTWLFFVFLTVVSWGLYGVTLHTGQVKMGDPVNGRWKAFLFVGIAYFLVAVLAPIIILIVNKASWSMPGKGITWSLIAGMAGAIGALGVLLAFWAKGTPTVVMAIVFAGAPVVNAIVAMMVHPPKGGFSELRWQFMAGILMAALGGFLVSYYRPLPAPPKPKADAAAPVPASDLK